MSLLMLLFGSLTTAHAVPVQLTQQGRLLDSSGSAVTGSHTLTFRLYDSQFGGNIVWEDSQSVGFTEGYYVTLLGNNLSNPLDDSVLASHPLYLEMEVDGGGPIGVRQAVVSTPYSRLSGTATHVSGGSVDALDVSIGGQLVIDSAGSWVGPAMAVNWSDLQNVPADIADGDDDSLAALSCNVGQIVGWDGAGWICSDDNGLTESEVEAYVTNDPLDFAAGSMVAGSDIVTQATDQDSFADLGPSCQSGDVAKWDTGLGAWVCDVDIDTDTVLSEADVEAYVTNGIGAFDLSVGTTLNGQGILTSQACAEGEFLAIVNGQWSCSSFQTLLDGDGDGVMSWSDCDDSDPALLSNATDNDCDGAQSYEDCDDTDPSSNTTAIDADCDGLITADDCDDLDPNSTASFNDADCDGVETAFDCNDSDPNMPNGDADCDGIPTADDCDDTDPGSNSTLNDADCDGVLSAIDCNDNDASMPAADADCDGAVTASDCDDNDPNSTTLANDADCDGFVAGVDCDDFDPNTTVGNNQNCAATTCLELLNNGQTQSGAYWIDPDGTGPIESYCDMDRDGGGWTLVAQNNQSVIHSDTPNWTQAVSGTHILGGNWSDALANFDMWLGVSHWAGIGTESRVEAGSSPNNPSIKGFYDISLSGPAYSLSVNSNSMTSQGMSIIDMGFDPHQGMGLTTYDADNDAWGGNCAQNYDNTPWWYYGCWNNSMWNSSNTDGPYFNGNTHTWGAIWLR